MSFNDLPYEVSHNIFNFLSPEDQRNLRYVSKNLNERMGVSIGNRLIPYTFSVYLVNKKIIYANRRQEGTIFSKLFNFPFDYIKNIGERRGLYLNHLNLYEPIFKIVCTGHKNLLGNLEGKFTCQMLQTEEVNKDAYDDYTDVSLIGDKPVNLSNVERFKPLDSYDFDEYGFTFEGIIEELRNQKVPEEYILPYLNYLYMSSKIYLDEENTNHLRYIDSFLSSLFEKTTFIPSKEREFFFHMKNGIPTDELVFPLGFKNDEKRLFFFNGKIVNAEITVKDITIGANVIEQDSSYRFEDIEYVNHATGKQGKI